MAAPPDTLATLDNLVELYKVDVTNHYVNATKDKKGFVRSVPRFGFSQLCKKVFDPIPAANLPSLFISLFDYCDFYVQQTHIPAGLVGNQQFRQSIIPLRDLILNVIVPYQLPQHNKKKVTEKGSGTKKVKNTQVAPRCTFTMDQAKALFKRFLPINLPADSKMWKQMKYTLMRAFKPEEAEQFSSIVQEHIKRGDISFSAISFIMQDPHINKNLDPELILHALYIGPLKAQTVETFASNRSQEFRKECRRVLSLAEQAKKDVISHGRLRPQHIPIHYAGPWSFQEYARHTSQMLGELKGVKTSHPEINHSWAFSAIKKFGKRTYIDKTYSSECFYDLIWTVLAQRHNMKKFIIDTLEKDFHDIDAARYWRKMNPAQMPRHHIKSPSVKDFDVLEDSDEFLNFPKTVSAITMVENAEQLSMLRNQIISEVLEKKNCIVGLDAEWSAFNGDSKASILQIALQNHIYIVDIESQLLRHDVLREFFFFLFHRKDILKIGFGFGEDLLQLRNAVANCRALCQPEKVICVGRMVSQLLEMTEKREDAEDILMEICPNFLTNDKANETVESIEDEKEKDNNDTEDERADEVIPSASSENLLEGDKTAQSAAAPAQTESRATKVLNKGLSYLCEQVLGRPLDKMEQCSIWDRRPLRPLQIRYAAMDAYCLLMLYDVCVRWAVMVGTDIDDLLSKQQSPRISPPLYSDDN